MTSTITQPALRGDEEELYRRHADWLLAATARSVRAPEALIEDACSYAWERLLVRQPERLHVNGWLRMVAFFRALHLVRVERRVTSLATLPEHRAGRVEAETTLEFLAALEIIEAVELSRRDARLLGLSAAGYSYAEMLAMTEETPRSLRRRLLRARRRIWAERGEEQPRREYGPPAWRRAA
jgi:hypothetical protein